MQINDVHLWEKAVVSILNFDGWELEWSGGGYEHYDAIGKTPKGFDCIMEMKFRQTYYTTKMLEVDKYDRIMNMSTDIVKLYFVNDPKANYLFYLNEIQMPEPVEMYCPDTTMWTKSRKMKQVYLLDESQAIIKNMNSDEIFN